MVEVEYRLLECRELGRTLEWRFCFFNLRVGNHSRVLNGQLVRSYLLKDPSDQGRENRMKRSKSEWRKQFGTFAIIQTRDGVTWMCVAEEEVKGNEQIQGICSRWNSLELIDFRGFGEICHRWLPGVCPSQQESCDTFVQVKKRRWKEKQGWGGWLWVHSWMQAILEEFGRKTAARGDPGAEGFKICARLVHD